MRCSKLWITAGAVNLSLAAALTTISLNSKIQLKFELRAAFLSTAFALFVIGLLLLQAAIHNSNKNKSD